MNLISMLKRIFQPVVDTVVATEKPQAEALVLSMGTKLDAAVKAAVTKHAPDKVDLIMTEVDIELAAIEAEIDVDIENFRVKL